MQDLRSTDLLIWASRYNLFVLWSADNKHPWDGLHNAERIAATLEIGKSDSEDRVIQTSCVDAYFVCAWCLFMKKAICTAPNILDTMTA